MPNEIAIVPRLQSEIPSLLAYVDGFTSERYTERVELSENPIETGAVVSDHAVVMPPSFELRGKVSDLTLNGSRRAGDAWGALRRLANETEPVLLATPFYTYDEVLIKEVDAEVSGLSFDFTMKMQVVLRVGAEVLRSGEVVDRQPTLNRGTVLAAPPADVVYARASQSLGRVGGVYGLGEGEGGLYQ